MTKMNKRQKKKVGDKLLFRVKKLHPGKNDLILLSFDNDKIDIDTAFKYYNAIINNFDDVANFVIVPNGITLKQMGKDDVLKYINKVREIILNE